MKKISQSHITLIRKLKHRKHRELYGKFIIEGLRSVMQIIANKTLEVDAIFVDENKIDQFKDILMPYYLVETDTFKMLSETSTPQGILAICHIPNQKKIEDLAINSGFIVATDGIQDPGNMGTIIRSSVWYGVSALLLGTGSVDIYNPKVVRSTAGATGIVPSYHCDLYSTLQMLQQREWDILLLDGSSTSQSIIEHSPKNKTVLVVGNEATGISQKLKTTVFKSMLLPSPAPQSFVESLNAAVATSIALAFMNK